MLRGTTNEMLTYDLNPEESRERTDEGMELILSLEGTATLRLAGKAFPLPHRVGVAKAAAAAAAANVCPRHQPRPAISPPATRRLVEERYKRVTYCYAEAALQTQSG